MPSLFLYTDFFVPLFYLGLLLIILFMIFKFSAGELKYKFLADYDAKHSSLVAQRDKFLDMNLDVVNYGGYNILSFFSVLNNSIFKGLNFNIVVVIIFLLFLMRWGSSLKENLDFANSRCMFYLLAEI